MRPENAADGVGGRHLFAIGAAHYTDPDWHELPRVLEDLPEMIDALGSFGYRTATGLPSGGLLDPPTGTDLQERLLGWVETQYRPGDALIIYHAGHGVEEGRHYLVCADTSAASPRMKTTALTTASLVELPGEAGVERLLVILDTCYAGDGTADALAAVAKNDLVAAVAPLMQRRHWKSLTVVAAAHSGESAMDGKFAEAFVGVLRDLVLRAPILVGERPPYVHVSDLVRMVNRGFARAGTPQRADYATLHDDGVGFFPNPHHVAELPVGVDLAQQQTLGSLLRSAAPDLLEHFGPRGMGLQSATERGHNFTGRDDALRVLADWLVGAKQEDIRVYQVTGGPGTGKSSVLGRIVTLSDPEARTHIPARSVTVDIPAGTVDLAIHAARKSYAEIVQSLADLLGSSSATPDGVIAAVAARPDGFTVVVDGIDEAGHQGDGDDALELADFFHLMGERAARARVLLGARPDVFTHHPVAPGRDRIDLDDAKWLQPRDIFAYVEQLLRAPHGPGSEPHLPPELSGRAAFDIVAIAQNNYLIARLVTRTLAHPDRELWHTAPSQWPTMLPSSVDAFTEPAGAVGAAFRWALITQLGPQQAERARKLLAPLAFTQGPGMPLAIVWSAAASAFTGDPVSEHELASLLAADAAAQYVVEALDEHGRSVYRLYHQALADELREIAPAAGASLLGALLDAVPRDAHGARDWRSADPYLLEHIAEHAAATGEMDQVLLDSGLLAYAEPRRLLPHLDGAATPTGELASVVYRSGFEVHRHAEPEDRRWILALNAARFGSPELTGLLRPSTPEQGLWPRWSTGSPDRAIRGTLGGHRGPVEGVWHIEIGGKHLVATSDFDAHLLLWDLATSTRIGELVVQAVNIRGRFTLQACTAVNGRAIALVVHSLNPHSVEAWDIARGTKVFAMEGHVGAVRRIVCHEIDGRPCAVVADDDGSIVVWDLGRRVEPVRLTVAAGAITAMSVATVYGKAHIVVTSADQAGAGFRLRLWRAEDRWRSIADISLDQAVHSLSCIGIDAEPHAVVASGDQNRDEGELSLWNLATGERTHTLAAKWADAVSCIEIDGRPYVVAGDASRSIHLWDLTSARRQYTLKGHASYARSSMCLTMNGRPIAVTGGNDWTARVWDLSAKGVIGAPMSGHRSAAVQVACGTIAGRPFAATCDTVDGEIRTWDLASGARRAKPVRRSETPPEQASRHERGEERGEEREDAHTSSLSPWVMELTSGHTKEPQAVACATLEGIAVMATISDDGIIRVRGQENGREIRQIQTRHRGRRQSMVTTCVAGRPVAVTADDLDGTVYGWDLATGRMLVQSRGSHRRGVSALACSEIGGVPVAVTGGFRGSLMLWSLADGYRLGEPIHTHDGRIWAIACTRIDGTPVAVTSSDDLTVRAWNLVDGQPLGGPFTGHTGEVWAVTCTSVGGRHLAVSGGEDRTLRVWDLDRHRAVLTRTMLETIQSMSTGADGSIVICTDRDILTVDVAPSRAPAG